MADGGETLIAYLPYTVAERMGCSRKKASRS